MQKVARRLPNLTLDLHKVGGNEQRHQGTATLAVHRYTESHALAHDDSAVHDHYCQGHQRI